jgi:hypothetical protein
VTTFVSLLVYTPLSSETPERRIALLRPLLASGLRLILYVDDFYLERIVREGMPRSVTLVPFRFADTATARQVAAAEPQPELPAERNPAKDTLHFLTIINAKAEVVARAVRDELALTPRVGFIDSGIAKVFRDPAASFARIRGADLSGLENVLIPGCWPPRPLGLADAANRVLWVFCGGLFVLPAGRAEEFFRRSHETQGELLRNGRYAWEVNVWALMAGRDPALFHWFAAGHDDRMSMLPPLPSPIAQPGG